MSAPTHATDNAPRHSLPTDDRRRITESDPRVVALRAVARSRLVRSVGQLTRDLRTLSTTPHASAEPTLTTFIHRHVALLRAAYQEGHALGARDYYEGVSRHPQQWARTVEADERTERRRLAFYAPSVAKMAHEALLAWQQDQAARIQASENVLTLADESALDAWQSSLGARLSLQADISWSGSQDGYVDAGAGDSIGLYSLLWWVLEPAAQHCSQCPEYAANSPYNAPGLGGNTLDTAPGAGMTECGAACKCSLSYASPGELEQPFWDAMFAAKQQEWIATGQQNPPPLPQVAGPARTDTAVRVTSPLPRRAPPTIPLEPLEPLTLPAEGAPLTDAQKGALDLYRATALAWEEWRGGLPPLPKMFADLADAVTGTDPQVNAWLENMPDWTALSPKQQQLLGQVYEALADWALATMEDTHDALPPPDATDKDGATFAEWMAGRRLLLGYNPYRDPHGRFAPGPHAPREEEGGGGGGAATKGDRGRIGRGGSSGGAGHAKSARQGQQPHAPTKAQTAHARAVSRKEEEANAAAKAKGHEEFLASHAAAVARRGGKATAKSSSGEKTLEQHTHEQLKGMAKESGAKVGKTKAETIANIRAKQNEPAKGGSERERLAALDPRVIHPTAADKFGSEFRDTYHVKADGQDLFVKGVRPEFTHKGVTYNSAAATRAADEASHLMGMEHLVTPTRIMERDGKQYAVMPWHEGKDVGSLSHDDLRQTVEKMSAKDLQRDAVFNYLLGDSDHSASGYMLRRDGSVRGIDYEGAFDAGSHGISNNSLLAHATNDHEFNHIALDRGVARDMLGKAGELRAVAAKHGISEQQLKAYDERVGLLRDALKLEHPAFYDLLDHESKQYVKGFDRSHLLTLGSSAAPATTLRETDIGDGGTITFSGGGGYNPYRDNHGRFAPGPHAPREDENGGGGGGHGGHASGHAGVRAPRVRTPAEHEHLLTRIAHRSAQREFDRASENQLAARDRMEQARIEHAATLDRVHNEIRAEALRRLPEVAPHAAQELELRRAEARAADQAKARAEDAWYRSRGADERMRADGDLYVAHKRVADALKAVEEAENRPIEAYVNREVARHPDVVAAQVVRARAEQEHDESMRVLRAAGTQLSAANHRLSVATVALRAERNPTGVSIVRDPGTEQTLYDMFGRHLSDGEIALLGGAARGDEVRIISRHSPYSVRVETVGKDRTAQFNLTGQPGHIVHSDAYVRNLGDKTSASGMEVIRTFENYRGLGITGLTALAARGGGDRLHAYNGYYTWAKLGATGKIPAHVLPAAQAKFGSHVHYVEDIMQHPEGPSWWKEHGDSFEAHFDFHDSSYSMRTLNGYLVKLREREQRGRSSGEGGTA